jgi:hypothetical protein
MHTPQKYQNRYTKSRITIIQATTKLRINPPHIITPPPTPTNTKVHKHPKWNKSSYLHGPPITRLPTHTPTKIPTTVLLLHGWIIYAA